MASLDPHKVLKSLNGRYHRHACTSCWMTYGCSCKTADINGTCSSCRSGHERPLWDRDLDPVTCCFMNSKMVKVEEVQRFALGGPGPWYRCRVCSRVHPSIPQ